MIVFMQEDAAPLHRQAASLALAGQGLFDWPDENV